MKILVIEDNPNLRKNLCFLLKKNKFLAEGVSNGKKGLEKLSFSKFDLIILDINMPIMNGEEFLEEIKKNKNNITIIALTAKSTLEDKLKIFELGVDDYITKPFEIDELVIRIKTILKRTNKIIENKKIIGDYEINFSKSKIFQNGDKISFPHKQYLIIEYLSKNIGFPCKKINIMEYVWGENEENLEFNSTTLESHIYSIRKKLNKSFIKTIKGVGYIIE